MVEPAANEIAGHSSTVKHFMVAAAAAQIARPATATGFLPIDVARGQPVTARLVVDYVVDAAHRRARIIDEAVARAQFAVGGDAEIARAGTAGQRAVRSA